MRVKPTEIFLPNRMQTRWEWPKSLALHTWDIHAQTPETVTSEATFMVWVHGRETNTLNRIGAHI